MSSLFNHDSEVAVLGILLKNPDRVNEVMSIPPQAFSSEPFEALFRKIVDLAENGILGDFTTLKSYYSGTTNSVVTLDLLNYLYNQDANANQLSYYTNLVMSSFRARLLMNTASRINRDVQDADLDYLISEVQKTLDMVTGTAMAEEVTSVSDLVEPTFEKIQERVVSGGVLPGVTTGFKDLDLVTGGFSSGDCWTVAARPSVGKSAWLCNSALSAAKQDVPVCIFSLEMSKEILVERLLAVETGIDLTRIRFGNLNQAELDRIFDASKQLRRLPIYIDSNFNADIDYIKGIIRKEHKKHGVRAVYLDYIQLLAERTSDATHEIGRITRGLKLIANELGLTVIILSQLNRGVELREDKRPVLSDLRQSGNIEEDSDVVLMLYRDELYNKDTKHAGVMENIIRKHRNGPTGTVFQKFIAESTKVVDA